MSDQQTAVTDHRPEEMLLDLGIKPKVKRKKPTFCAKHRRRMPHRSRGRKH